MSNGMYQKFTCCLALCLAIASQLSHAANNARDLTDHPCTRNDGNPGYCRRPRKCPQFIPLLRALKANILTPQQTKYIRDSGSSICKNSNKICCEYLDPEKYQEAQGLKHLLDQECGGWGTAKVFGGKEIVLMSRPWMALLMFKDPFGRQEFTCGGTLIHKRFVLTAAHCFDNKELISVRLGEHNVTSVQDCTFIRGRHRCAPPVENITVNSTFVHEGFKNHSNDIALVKLSADVEFQEHIRPICLPFNEALQQEVTNITDFKVTGWGKSENSSHSDVPLETSIKQQNASVCQKAFNQEIRSTQLCVGQEGNDSCNGDSGGPLADVRYYQETQRFVQYGIVSYGSRNCARGDPGVYTSVSKFIPWIADIIAKNYGD